MNYSAANKKLVTAKVIAVIIWYLFLLIGLINVAWPLTSWGRIQALQTANKFMGYLNSGNYQASQNLIDGVYQNQDEYERIASSLGNPQNNPIQWDLEISAPFVATGSVTLSGGEEIPVSIFLDWQWTRASWVITGVQYHQDSSNDSRIHFALYSSGISFSVFKKIVLALAIASAVISASYLLVLHKRAA